MSDFDDFLESANAEFDTVATKQADPKYARTRFTCESCGGSGLWRGGRANQHGNAKCNTCHGRGYLVTSPEARARGRARAAAAKRNRAEVAREQNAEHGNGFLLQWLSDNAHWNTFAASLIEQHNAGRAWSDRQVESCRAMYAKIKANEAAREAERQTTPKVDTARILQMFRDALANGKKQRALLAGRFGDVDPDTGKPVLLNKVKMTPARDGERVWVKVDGEYCGGIMADGSLRLNRVAPDWLSDRLIALAADPDGECRLYGQNTGICSCCGATLTNQTSINLGIGPRCRAKWGLA